MAREKKDPLDGGNVAVAQGPAGNLKPAKDKSTERIDGSLAIVMALGRAMVAQEEQHVEWLSMHCSSFANLAARLLDVFHDAIVELGIGLDAPPGSRAAGSPASPWRARR